MEGRGPTKRGFRAAMQPRAPAMGAKSKWSRSLGPHPKVGGVERRFAKLARRVFFALDEYVEYGTRRGKLRRHAREGQALADPVSVRARGDHADTCVSLQHGFAAACVGVAVLDFRVHDLERPGRLVQDRGLADEIALVQIDEARH